MNKGFTLIELAIAIFILVVGIIGVYNSFSTVVVLTAGSSSRFTAAYLAQEGIEIVRNMRDNNWIKWTQDQSTNWNYGLLGCENGCEADYKTGTPEDVRSGLTAFGGDGNNLKIGAGGFYSYDEIGGSSPTKFKRKITITSQIVNGVDVLKVSVLVTWKEKEQEGCDHGFCIDVEEYLYDWY
ncbi:MAG: prepilin-type N-terminal cleavage/methylation domain-containing protein [Candidatus Staskawiczbacteria bacterium]|nr:prepilin-type N-terminal cleavage/methylation domain-containing protein [Candidatus Staskawiczbacteria bacterium]